ncbi:DUF6119 family protein [Pseudomonas sp. NPDC086112]|uniref:DUF6119 family protein n=1 Tax=Pseudomonas sp. NPDC086112 TaxID=3364430 RepID=UPI0038116D9D
MDDDQQKSMSLSIRLLKNGKTHIEALREGHSLKSVPSENGVLFVDQSPEKTPGWYKFIGEFASAEFLSLKNQSCAAVLFLQIQSDSVPASCRTMVLTFGTGHHSLDLDACERGFGLRVALNCIARSSLRGVDVATLDATTFQKRIQASRKADLGGFGLDIERDLLRLAAGIPSDTTFARALTGRDALNISTVTSPSSVIGKCKKALELFQSLEYRRDYAWVDLISPVTDKNLVSDLDVLVYNELVELLDGRASDLHIALPDIIGPEDGYEIGYFGVGLKSGKKDVFLEVSIEDYIGQIQAGRPSELSSMDVIKHGHEIRVVINGEGDRRQKRKIYDCFVYEVVLNGNTYVLFGGDWYLIDGGFYHAVEAEFRRLVSLAPFVASTYSKNERDFIAELDADVNLLNLDQVKLSPLGATNSNLEPCDFLCRTKRFIHLKDGHSSAPISHLWNQGLVSAESFVRDDKFRRDLRAAAVQRQRATSKSNFHTLLPTGGTRPEAKDYKVVFGIMRHRYKSSGLLGLPFFSKVSLRAVAKRIELMGYPVEVHLIEKL